MLSRGREAWAEVSCPRLVDMESGVPVAVSAVWKLELAKGDRRMYWHVRLENNAGDMVEKCYFPYLNGIWLGDDWTKDELYMPVHSGDKTVNPTRTLSATPHQISWKWQEYQYTFTLGGPYGVKNERLGCWERECGYSGPCSMLYMILSNPYLNMSVYLTCRNDALRMKSIRAATYGESWPGVSLALGHVPLPGAGKLGERGLRTDALCRGLACGGGRLPGMAERPGASGAVPAAPPGLVHGKPRLGGAL